jgi:hypothetical protein
VSSVTSVTYNGNELVKGTDYTIAIGKLTINAGVIQAIGSHDIVVKSSAYEDAKVSLIVKAGAAVAAQSAYSLSGTLAEGQSVTATAIVKDKYGNLTAGKQVYADITVTNTTRTKAERYTFGIIPFGTTVKGVKAGALTDENGATVITITMPSIVDTGDGVSIQLRTGATLATATAFGDPITFTK